MRRYVLLYIRISGTCIMIVVDFDVVAWGIYRLDMCMNSLR